LAEDEYAWPDRKQMPPAVPQGRLQADLASQEADQEIGARDVENRALDLGPIALRRSAK
jgi:hypothetical protein